MGTDAVGHERVAQLRHPWSAGAVAGLVGGVGMGVVLHAGANVMPLIGALYGWPTVVGGWAAHLANSVLIGLLFTAIVSRGPVREHVETTAGYALTGVGYAAAVGLVTAGVMLPVTMTLRGVRTLPEPVLPLPSPFGVVVVVLSVGVAHVVYGLLLGVTYGRLGHAGLPRRAPGSDGSDRPG